MLGAELRIVRVGVDARTDGRGTHVDLVEEPHVGLQTVDLLGQRCGVGLELLPEGHRHGVLQLRAAHLDDVGKLLALGVECGDELLQRRHGAVDAPGQCDAHGRRVGVVGRLREIDVVVRVAVVVFALVVAEQFERPVGNHLVGVHVCRCAGASLYHVHDELFVEPVFTQLFACPGDRVGDRRIEQPQVAVGGCSPLLHVGQRVDQARKEVEPHAADVEVLHGPHGLNTEVVLFGNLHFSEQIVLTARFARQFDLRKIHSFVNFLMFVLQI